MDAGLFAPVWAGTEVAALTSDEAFLQAMLDAEAALARAQARLGVVPATRPRPSPPPPGPPGSTWPRSPAGPATPATGQPRRRPVRGGG